MIAFICICSEEYLSYYKVLFESIKIHYPKANQILYYVGEENSSLYQFDKVRIINDWYDKTSYSDKLTKICSLRARVILESFNEGFNKVVFTGAKVKFFNDPFKLIDPLSVLQDPFNAVVTPHILEPLPEDGFLPSNASVSWTGHISTDIVSFRDCPQIRKFLTWQDEIMKTKCNTTNYTYLDQSWLNFLPFFVDDVKILRDPAYNVAYWNYEQRKLNDIVCFQYSGIDLDNPQQISRHQNRYKAEGGYLKFLTDYCDEVKNARS